MVLQASARELSRKPVVLVRLLDLPVLARQPVLGFGLAATVQRSSGAVHGFVAPLLPRLFRSVGAFQLGIVACVLCPPRIIVAVAIRVGISIGTAFATLQWLRREERQKNKCGKREEREREREGGVSRIGVGEILY